VDAVVAKKTMSEFGDFGTPRSNLTGFTGAPYVGIGSICSQQLGMMRPHLMGSAV
jgi:hypothetical protein